MRMLSNLLPLLRRAHHLRRVVTVLAGTYEGKLYTDDITGRNTPLRDTRAHLTSAVTIALEGFARQAPEVSFVHNYPGVVDTNLIRAESGWCMQVVKWCMRVWYRNQWMDYEECGERHCYLCVSDRYSPATGGIQGVAVVGDDGSLKGTDGCASSGVYSVDAAGENGGDRVFQTLKAHRESGHVDAVQKHLASEFMRITGSVELEVQGSFQG